MVFCQRRKHKWFLFIKQYIEEVIAQYWIPITYIGYYHSDGMWNMPNEFVYRENHPYKYWYGKLLHSGYHFIDICGYLTNLNNNHTKQINMYVSEINAKDTFAYANQYTFEKIFPNWTFHTNLDTYMNKIVNFGEVDCFINLQLLNQVWLVETTLQLDLLQTGFSRRAWQELPIDTYKGNGRLRHEYININLGHLVNIKVHSYKSFEKTNKAESTNFKYHYEVGASNHFEIQIFRNNQLIWWKSFEIIDLWKESENLMENARDSLFRDFVFYWDNASSYYAHEINMQLLNNMYWCLYNIRHNKIPFRKITLK
jgi:hypothetical protein